MRHNLYIVTLLMLYSIRLSAVPALPISKIVTQKDSTRLEVFLRGDEHSHCYFTSDNIPVASGEDGSYFYVFVDNDSLKLSTMIAHEKNERDEEELLFIKRYKENTIDFLSREWTKRLTIANYSRIRRNFNITKSGLNEPKGYIGSKKGLVILVNFANKEMSMSNANHVFNRMFNEVGYDENNCIGSVHDYFYDQSYRKFDLTFDVVGPVTVRNNYGYYGSNGINLNGGDLRAGEMIVEACQLADKEVNFADYDWDGDGEVDQVYIIYAGYGEASGGPKNSIWPHESHLEYQECGVLELDGVIINTYACSCELTGESGTTLNGIGTPCHEFSHCLGLPDLYDTGYSGGFGMSYWDIMSSGSHCGPNGIGEVPTGYSAYERQFVGWLDLKELDTPCVINDMPSIGDEPVAYVIYNDNHRDEFFILENRQNNRWFSFVDTYKDCHGLLVTHVDYSETAWRNNRVNTSRKHQRMTIIPADMSYGSTYSNGEYTYYHLNKKELQGDLFPGLQNITELTNTSHETTGGKLYNFNTDGSYYMNKPLTNISEKNGLISFDFMGGIYVPIPEVLSATEITKSSFIANWNPVEGANSYTLELSELKPQGPPIDNIILSENLAIFKTGKNTDDGFTDLSDKLDTYMQHKGWEGQKVYTSQYGVKLGTTTTTGFLKTPQFDINSNSLTIRFTAKAITSAGANIQFVVMNTSGTPQDIQECKLYYTPNQFVVNFDNLDLESLKVKITSPERIYMSDVIFYDGYYVESDFKAFDSFSHMTGVHGETIENLTDNKYYFSDLNEEAYRYRVRANMNGAKSGWSPYYEVSLKGESKLPIVDLAKNTMVYDIYSVNGTKVNTILQSGIYIVRDKKGTSKKIIIR